LSVNSLTALLLMPMPQKGFATCCADDFNHTSAQPAADGGCGDRGPALEITA
jgi:hypothetical protein